MKKHNTKGFSLVELIVVIAIMAVLVGVLAPSLLSYVEKSRAQKDDSAMSEVTNAVQLALADEAINREIAPAKGASATIVYTPAAGVVTIKDGAMASSKTVDDYSAFKTELASTLPATITLTSNTHKAQTYTITITVSAAGAVSVSGAWN